MPERGALARQRAHGQRGRVDRRSAGRGELLHAGEPEAAAQAACIHLDNTLQDYRREIQRRVFG